MSDFQQWASNDSAPWLKVNQNLEALEGASLYAERSVGHTGLVYGYMGGVFKDTTKAAGTTTLADDATNYIVAALSDGTISDATSTTNWDDDSTYARVAKVTTLDGAITAVVDYRFDEFGLFPMLAASGGGAVTSVNGATGAVTLADLQETGLNVDAVGFRGVPLNSQSGNYTTVASDAGKAILHASGAGAGDTFTIDSNANVAYEVGTAISFVNMDSNALSIAITSDTMNLAGAGTTGTRSLAQYGVATALKVASTTWLISGTNLT
jgi:hypothetical protein